MLKYSGGKVAYFIGIANFSHLWFWPLMNWYLQVYNAAVLH